MYVNLVYSLSNLLNNYSITFLIIIFSLFNLQNISADIALIQGATTLFYYSLSGNARNIIILNYEIKIFNDFLKTRFVLLFPVLLLSITVCINLFNIDSYLIIIILIRKSIEWFSEISIAYYEKNNNYLKSWVINICEFIGIIFIILNINNSLLKIYLTLWAFIPIVGIVMFNFKKINYKIIKENINLNFDNNLYTYFISTISIGLGFFIFRYLINLFVDKNYAGDLFAIFAIGGIIPNILGQIIMPSIFNQSFKNKLLFFKLSIIICILIIILIVVCNINKDYLINITNKNEYYIDGILYSLLAGLIMLASLFFKAILYKKNKAKFIFIADILANLLICLTIFIMSLCNLTSLYYLLYLFSAILNLFFIYLVYIKYGNRPLEPKA
jgi:hypothetical protein